MKKFSPLLLVFLFLMSCKTSNDVASNGVFQKRKYNKGWYHEKGTHSGKSTKIENYPDEEVVYNEENSTHETGEFSTHETYSEEENFEEHEPNFEISESENYYQSNDNFGYEDYSIDDDENCDEIIMRNGDIILAKVKEVGVSEIRYVKCSNPDGPIYSTLKSEIFMIKYANGDKDVFKEESGSSVGSSSSGTFPVEPWAIASLGMSALAMFMWLLVSIYFGLGLAIAALVFALISFMRLKKYKDKYSKGKWVTYIAGITSLATIAVTFIVTMFVLF